MKWRKRQREVLRYSVTVTYSNQGANLLTSRVGYGESLDEALQDSDRQLKDGVWRRVCVTPIYSHSGRSQDATPYGSVTELFAPGEDAVIRVKNRVSERIIL